MSGGREQEVHLEGCSYGQLKAARGDRKLSGQTRAGKTVGSGPERWSAQRSSGKAQGL